MLLWRSETASSLQSTTCVVKGCHTTHERQPKKSQATHVYDIPYGVSHIVYGLPCEKKMCMEMKTMVTPMQKLMVRAWPNRAADMRPVKMVAIVEEYFFSMVSAYLKKKDDRMPCKALLTTRSMVTCRYAHASAACRYCHSSCACIDPLIMLLNTMQVVHPYNVNAM